MPDTEVTAGATAAEEPTPNATAGAGASASSGMPVSEAVKHIGGTKAGSSHVSQQPTAHKAIDAVPVGPDPAAAAALTGPTALGTAGAGTTGTGFTIGATDGGAATNISGSGSGANADATVGDSAQPDDSNTDGDHYLDAALADSNMGDEGLKPAPQPPATTATTDVTKTGFFAPPAAEQTAAAEGGTAAGHSIAAEAAAEQPDVPTGLSADTHAVGSAASGIASS